MFFESFLSGKCTSSSVAGPPFYLECEYIIREYTNSPVFNYDYKQRFVELGVFKNIIRCSGPQWTSLVWKRNSHMLLLLLSCEMFGLFLPELAWNKYPVLINLPFRGTCNEGKSSYPIRSYLFICLFVYLLKEWSLFTYSSLGQMEKNIYCLH